MGDLEDICIIHRPTNTEYDIYPAMKKFPATSAIMVKCLFKRFIVSPVFKEVKNRELFSYWAKASNPKLRELFSADGIGFNNLIERANSIQRLAAEGFLTISKSLYQLRKLLAWIEIAFGSIISDERKKQVTRIVGALKDMIAEFAYQNVHKTCHNEKCRQTCRLQCSCRETRYCSAACQLADWKRHKQTCQFIRK
jgi:hypothetical protein